MTDAEEFEKRWNNLPFNVRNEDGMHYWCLRFWHEGRKPLKAEISQLEEKVRELENKETGARHFIEHELMQICPRLETKLKQAEARIKELETDLKLNASMLAKQCDLAREAEASLTRLLEAVEKLKPLAIRTHYYCEDCWFTCPKHPEGCCNEAVGPDCNCGADEHNREVEAFYQVAEEIKKGGKDEI